MKRARWGFVALVVFLLACVTVNIYFPVTAAEKTAEEIVKEVREQIPEKEEEEKNLPDGSEKQSWHFIKVAYAQGGEALEVSNASIRAIKASLKDRYPAILPYLQKGIVGENQDGFVEVRTMEGLALPGKAQVKQLVDAENKDRTNLYREVGNALKIDQNQVGRLQEIFAKEWQKSVPPGSWIQADDGSWVTR
ncbi:MAG: DUF1318 domain-containing protein [Deltaproteobacteria bacterium]|nr:DUF1318 domain-containing protein [Deltaproteobacteria bacterium]